MKKILIIIIIIIINISLTGCWNSREINTLAIATALGIDKENDDYKVTVQALNPNQIASKKASNQSPVVIYSAKGKTVFEAVRKITEISPRKIYMSHLRVVVLGEELAKEGISKTLDFLGRDHEFRTDYYFIIAKETTAFELLNVLTPLEIIPANKIYDSLKTSEDAWAPTKSIRLIELVNSIVAKGKDPVITGMFILGEKAKQINTDELTKSDTTVKLKLTTLGAFKGDKLVGWLDENESKGYNYIIQNVKNTVGFVEIDKNTKVSVEVTRAKSKIKVNLVNNKPQIDVQIKLEGNVGEVQGEFDVSKSENLEKANKLIAKKAEQNCNKSIIKAQKELESDVFGFGEAIHRKYPKVWKEIEKNWDEEFTNLPVKVEATCEIKKLGTISKPFFIKESE